MEGTAEGDTAIGAPLCSPFQKLRKCGIFIIGMLTYEQAYEAALRLMPNIDACAEYENAYMFKRKAENHSIGGHGFIIIMKDSGKTVPQTEFFEKYATELIREFDVTAEDRKSKKTRKK